MTKKIILSFFLLFFSALKAEVIENVIIEGNKRISDETIKIYGEVELNKNFTESELNKVLSNLNSTNFFENIEINLNNKTLKIVVKEYPFVNQLIILGEPKKSNVEEIKKLIQIKSKRPFIKANLAKDIDIIKKLYSSLGYNFAEVDAKIKEIDKDNLDLLIEIERGEQTKISSIKFIGNKNIRSRRLRDVIASSEDKFWKVLSNNTNLSENLINLDRRLLTNYYKSLGYYDIKITSNIAEINKAGNADLVYSIEEGTRYTINKISTNIDEVFDKNLFFPLNKEFKKYIGDYYSPFKIKKLLEELDRLIEFNNLQFVEHNVKEDINNDSINITLNIYEGPRNLVERINITGNNVTNEDVIRGELILDEGDPFVNLSLEKSIAKIKARNIFNDVTYEINDGSENNLKIIDINVEERPTGEISAGAGVGTSGGTIAFNIKENNWLGQGKSVGLEIQADEESLIGDFRYTDPNYNFLGNSITYSLLSERNDKPDLGFENSIIAAAVGTSFEQYKDIKVRLGLQASHDDLQTEDSASASLKKQNGTYSELTGNYGFTFDKRDKAFMPTSGSIFSFGQSIPIAADKAFITNTISSSFYKSLSENIIGSTKIYIASINGLGGEDVRISKRRGISSSRLRGFEKNKVGPVDGSDHVGGNYVAALNFETNLPNVLPENSNADVGLFLDFGNVWGVDYDSSIDESNKIRSSTGVTVNWLSPIGPLNFVISQNLSKADTDVTESFTFNLGTTF
ncbi:outer membrane protein assembly factor BamA [Candidatus Pelagibacter communis]|uniref:outer membrane protein assembly factor BamA n=1 Tax=Pelagibacter ubique TaxID=198252 RepID=UPI00094C810F|nr:outer membrane protein assembly factor BamA [Candidatus Pelagibacter ubique]